MPAYPGTEASVRHIGGNYTMNSTTKELYEERLRVHTELRKLQDSGIFEGEQYGNLDRAFMELTERIKTAEREETLSRSVDEPIKPTPDALRKDRERQDRSYDMNDPFHNVTIWQPGEIRNLKAPQPTQTVRKAFRDYLTRRADVHEIRRTLQADKDAVGGFLTAPESYTAEVIRDLHDLVHIRRIGRNVTLPTAQSIAWPILDDTVDDSNWTSELKTGSEDAAMDFMKMSLTPHPSAKRVLVSETLLRRGSVNVEGLIRSRPVRSS